MRTASVFATAAVLCSAASYSLAAPTSDGSIFKETFTTYPEDAKSSATGTATTTGGAANIVTTQGTGGTEGMFKATSLALAPSTSYVLEYDFTINAESGNNWYILYANSASGFSDITIRSYGNNAGLEYNVQVDYGTGSDFAAFTSGFSFGTKYHVALEYKVDNTLDLYVDGILLGNYADRNPTATTNLIQFGDPSTGAGFGNMTIDNVSIGVIPEPTSLAAIGLLGMAALRRRR